MGNTPGIDYARELDMNVLASGRPQELDWEKLITHVFQSAHRPLLLLTSDQMSFRSTYVGSYMPCKAIDVFRILEGRTENDAGCAGAREAFSADALGGHVGIMSQKGKKQLPNQDSAFYLSFVDGDGAKVWLACVMDGHGPLGHLMSRLVMQWLPLLVLRDPAMATDAGLLVPLDPQQVLDGLAGAFSKMGELMARASSGHFDKRLSGTTCAFALCARGLLNSANVGDSRAVLGALREDSRSSFALNVDVWPLTRDHKPEDVEERLRIEAHGGRVNNQRVYIKEWPYVGLNLSRSFGDSMVHKVGVISTPDVAAAFLDSCEGQFLLVASDGVWEFLSNAAALETLAVQLQGATAPAGEAFAPSAAQQAVVRLVRRSTEEWYRESHELDDITAVLVRIPGAAVQAPPPRRSPRAAVMSAAAGGAS